MWKYPIKGRTCDEDSWRRLSSRRPLNGIGRSGRGGAPGMLDLSKQAGNGAGDFNDLHRRARLRAVIEIGEPGAAQGLSGLHGLQPG